MAMSENSRKVFDYVKENGDANITSADVAEALDLAKKTVDGCFTALQKKGLGVRIPAEAELEDGTHRAIKLLKLTDAGMSYDPDEEEA